MALKVVGSSPTNYPVGKITFFKKNKIKKRQFRKKIYLINRIYALLNMSYTKKNIFWKYFFYKRYIARTSKFKKLTEGNLLLVLINQKKFNPKSTIFSTKNVNTFSVGSIIKYFKVKQAKYIRRSLKGLKIFLNFLKNSLEKFYMKKNGKHVVISISGVDYNLINLKKNLKNLVKFKDNKVLLLLNLKISFTKKKDKKIKAIKKRLKKKIIANFVKNTI